MGSNWSLFFTIFLAVVLARLFERALLPHSSNSGTQVSAVISSPAEPVVVYANPIDRFLKEHHPNAVR